MTNPPNTSLPQPVHQVSLQRTEFPSSTDELLWSIIKDRTAALSFSRYSAFIEAVLSDTFPQNRRDLDPWRVTAIRRAQQVLGDPDRTPEEVAAAEHDLAEKRLDEAEGPTPEIEDDFAQGQLPQVTPDVDSLQSKIRTFGLFDGDAYELLKAATEFFVHAEAGRLEDLGAGEPPTSYLSTDYIQRFRASYLAQLTSQGRTSGVLPYLAIIRRRLSELPVKAGLSLGLMPESYGILRSRLQSPVLLELIWNYWQEQGRLVQTINLVSLRFQNIRRGPGPDPLANLELDPLRPLSNVLWGYLQDEINRLTVARRAYEYAHGLGLQLVGKAVPEMHPADVRSQFLPAFHDLLRLSWTFFREDDDKTVVADAFPLLNALRELHFVVSEGAHNQFGDLPMRARTEMLMQQWILARPEMRDFLRGRTMTPYPEPWMDRVDAMKALQGWSDASVINYNDLATFGEQILLSVRYGDWSTTPNQVQAANWARAWRPAIQRYTHALRIVSGIDLSTADVVEVRTETERITQGIVSGTRGRVPQPGGTFSFAPAPPTARVIGPRPPSETLLPPAPPVVADAPPLPGRVGTPAARRRR